MSEDSALTYDGGLAYAVLGMFLCDVIFIVFDGGFFLQSCECKHVSAWGPGGPGVVRHQALYNPGGGDVTL